MTRHSHEQDVVCNLQINRQRPRARSVSLTSLRRQRSTSCDSIATMTKTSPSKKTHKGRYADASCRPTCSSAPLTPVSLLCYAVLYNDEVLLRKLLQSYPCDINNLSDDGMSPLHLATLDGSINIMKILINNGAKVDNIDYKGRSVLQYAVWGGQFDAAQLLIQHGCDSSLIIDGFTH